MSPYKLKINNPKLFMGDERMLLSKFPDSIQAFSLNSWVLMANQ